MQLKNKSDLLNSHKAQQIIKSIKISTNVNQLLPVESEENDFFSICCKRMG